MNLTTKGRYAVTAILDLATNANEQTPVSLNDISARQGISLSYLEQIFVKLKNYGVVKSIRGAGGGYILAKANNEISIADIISAVDEQIKITGCNNIEKSNCAGDNVKCIAHDLWDDLELNIFNYMKTKKLSDVINSSNIKAHKKFEKYQGEEFKTDILLNSDKAKNLYS